MNTQNLAIAEANIYTCPELEELIKQLIQEIESFDKNLKDLKRSPKYDSRLLKKMAVLEEKIQNNKNKIREAEYAKKFSPDIWVCKYGGNKPGKVIYPQVIGRVIEILVLWDNSTAPVPERVAKLQIVDPKRCQYIWNGERHSKLIRPIDNHECDDFDILAVNLSRLELEVGSALPEEWQAESKSRANYCRKRIKFLQSRELERLEQIVKDGLTVFYRVGEALAEIRDRQLYKQQGYSDFREYLIERWNMGKSKAYRLIDAAEVMNNLKSVPNWGQLPQNEAIAREIAKALPENQIGVWRTAIEQYGENPTAKEVEAVVSDFQNSQPNNSSSPDDKQEEEIAVQTNSTISNSDLVKRFEVGQLVKLQLLNFEGASESLRMANHSHAQITSFTESGCSLCVSILESDKNFIVSPQDIQAVDLVDFKVSFSSKQFIALISIYKTKQEIINSMKLGVLGK